MIGIYGTLLNNKEIQISAPSTKKNTVHNSYSTDYGLLGQIAIDKCKSDRFIVNNSNITLCFEGVNLSAELQSKENHIKAYKKYGINFLNELRGSFCGYILDENTKKLYIFTDNLATKSVFFYYNKEHGFVFSSNLASISKTLKHANISTSIDRDAVYQMALYGFILKDRTYVREIKKLEYSCVLEYNLESLDFSIKKLHTYQAQKRSINYSKAIDSIEDLMLNSVKDNWKKSAEYSNKHLSLLSGGMDARVNLLLAKELGYNNISTITFGQSDSKDISYAQKIAIAEGFNHYQRILDTPSYLTDNIYYNYIIPNDGMMMFHTSAHTTSTIRSFSLDEFSVLHTGQIGDMLFGSFNHPNFDFEKNKDRIGYTGFVHDRLLLDKIESLPTILEEYQEKGYELYSLEQRQINATIYGDRTLSDHIDNLSPFYNRELIDFCLTLPSEFKINQMIYFDWLKINHGKVLEYPWDKINMRPNSKIKIKLGKAYKKYTNGAKKYFRLSYESMNPYQRWVEKYPAILENMDSIFREELEASYIDSELKEDLTRIYSNNTFEYRNKFAVITALLALKLHFGD